MFFDPAYQHAVAGHKNICEGKLEEALHHYLVAYTLDNSYAGKISYCVNVLTSEHLTDSFDDSSFLVKLISILCNFGYKDTFLCGLIADLMQKNGIHSRAKEFKLRALYASGVKNPNDPTLIASIESGVRDALNRPARKSILFHSLNGAGASALDPILRDFLRESSDYDVFRCVYDPSYSALITNSASPFYLWTHEPVSNLVELLKRPLCIVCLHRDPRDAIISRVADNNLRYNLGMTKENILYQITDVIPPELEYVREFIELANDGHEVIDISFNQLKSDTFKTVSQILSRCNVPFDPQHLEDICHRHSYERVTGRSRGDNGAIVRSEYLFRKGVSGDWVNYFDRETAIAFNRYCGQFLTDFGYEASEDWIANVPEKLPVAP